MKGKNPFAIILVSVYVIAFIFVGIQAFRDKKDENSRETANTDNAYETTEEVWEETTEEVPEQNTEEAVVATNTDETEKLILQGETYTFYEVDEDMYLTDSDEKYNIFSVYEELDTTYHGLYVGQVATLFGNENFTDDNENLFAYFVAAEKQGEETIYLEIYYGPSGPAIGGMDTPKYNKAAEELVNIIVNVEPMDFSCESIYWDADLKITMGTKNGKGFCEVELYEGTFD